MSTTLAAPPRLDYPYGDPPTPGHALEVAPGVLWLRMPLPFALDHINVWLLRDDDAWTLVDTGYGSGATRELWEQHLRVTLDGRPLTRIVATHYHPDHVGNAEWLIGRTGARFAMTAAEFASAHAAADGHSGYEVERVLDLLRQHGMARDDLEALQTRGNAYRRGVPSLPPDFERLHDGDTLQTGGTSWRVLEGHGHSPEHASLHSAASAVLISGDMLLPRISTNVSVWPVDAEGDPLGAFLASIARLRALPDTTLVLPSHGLPFRGIDLRVTELEKHHVARLEELEHAVLTRGRVSAAELVPVLFPRKLDLQQRFFAIGETIAHLNHLWHAGRVARASSGDNDVLFAPPA